MGGDTSAIVAELSLSKLQMNARHEDEDAHVRPSPSKASPADLRRRYPWARHSAKSAIKTSREESRAGPAITSHAVKRAAMPSASKSDPAEKSGTSSKQSSLRPPEAPLGTFTIEMCDPLDGFEAIAVNVNAGFHASIPPVLVDDCTGGVYLLRSRQSRLIAVFKPADEEAYAPNNPKKFTPCQRTSPVKPGEGIRVGIPAGHASVREFAAYLLDKSSFAGVPATAIASASHASFQNSIKNAESKRGALQAYIPHLGAADDVSVSHFDTANVHAIATLDIRLANQDRHGGNLLVVKNNATTGGHQLVPIDHGACLPRVFALNETSFAWLFWPQARQPFDARTIEYISTLDAFADEEMLRDALGSHGLDNEALLTLHFCTALLKTCALDWQLTAHEIGLLMTRQTKLRYQHIQKPSVLEDFITKTLEKFPVDGLQVCQDVDRRRNKITAMVSNFRFLLSDHLKASGKQRVET